MSETEPDEPTHVPRTWRDMLPRIPRPVWAIGAQQLYRVLIHGSGFSLNCDAEPIVGFFTTRFVAAANVRDAETKARLSVLTEWKRRGFEASAQCAPLLDIEDIELLQSRFRIQSGAGFIFFTASED